jgi:hypothetical protein
MDPGPHQCDDFCPSLSPMTEQRTRLASLQSGFGVKDLLFALNDSAVNFASDSAEVPEAMAPT